MKDMTIFHEVAGRFPGPFNPARKRVTIARKPRKSRRLIIFHFFVAAAKISEYVAFSDPLKL